mgnify:CR=1 FL=1
MQNTDEIKSVHSEEIDDFMFFILKKGSHFWAENNHKISDLNHQRVGEFVAEVLSILFQLSFVEVMNVGLKRHAASRIAISSTETCNNVPK